MPPIRSNSSTSSESSSGHRAVKRARAIQSCALCRKKKIKCDRQDPCSACIAKGEYCHWEVPPPPPQHKYQYAAELCSEMTPEEEVLCLRRLVRVLSANVPARAFEDMVKSITPKYKLRDWAQRAAGGDHGSDNEAMPKQEPFETALPSPALTSSEHEHEHEHSDVEAGSSCFSSPELSSAEPEYSYGQPHAQSAAFGSVPTFSLASSPVSSSSSILNTSFAPHQLPHQPFVPGAIFGSIEPTPLFASPTAMTASDYAQLQAQAHGLAQAQCGPSFADPEEISGTGFSGANGIGAQMLAGGLWPFALPMTTSAGHFSSPQQPSW